MNQKIIASNRNITEIVRDQIQRLGNHADLNHIDVSQVTDMTYAFGGTDFNGDISQWDVSNVRDMTQAFAGCDFNGDISKWNVSNVETMSGMFYSSRFKGDISAWDVSSVKNMSEMFAHSSFNGNISRWKINKECYSGGIFHDCDAIANENFGELHLDAKIASQQFGGHIQLHPAGEAAVVFRKAGMSVDEAIQAGHEAYEQFGSTAEMLVLDDSESIGEAIAEAYQASQMASDDLVNVDFTMSTDWTVGCDPTANENQTSKGHDLSY